MKGLIIKDLYVVLKQTKILLLFVILMSLTSGGVFAMMGVFVGCVLPMTAIAYDERSKWNELSAMMPYSKKDLVISKYALGYIGAFSAFVLMCIGTFVSVQFIGVVSDLRSAINILLLAVAGGLTFISIYMPLIFKFGSEKVRYIYLIAMGVFGGISSFITDIIPLSVSMNFQVLIYIMPFAVVAINIASIAISMKIKIKA